MHPRTRRPSKPAAVHPLREARVKAKLTQQDVADRLEVTKAAVSAWELGRRYPLPGQAVRIRSIQAALGEL